MGFNKNEKYAHEQEDIRDKILNKLGITCEKNRIRKDSLEDESVKEFVNSLMNDIKKYYKMSQFRPVKLWKQKELNIIMNIMKYHHIEIIKQDKKEKLEDGKYHNYRLYIFHFSHES